MPLDPELQSLAPLFVEEARERLERLATLCDRLQGELAGHHDAYAEVRRELHTVKGAARMLQLPTIAELCHAAEELVERELPDTGAELTRVVDRLSEMVDDVARGEAPGPAVDLAARIGRRLAEAAQGPADPAPEATIETPEPATAPEPPPTPEPVPEPVGVPSAAATEVPAAAATDQRPRTLGTAEVRVDAAALDAVADQATQVRILALSSRGSVDRLYELAKLAEQGLREPQPTQVLAVLATMLRRLAVDIEGGQRRLLRSSEEGLDRLLTLQLQPLRTSLVGLARYARELARSLGREVEVDLEGEETRLDRRIARELEEALLHLVRNAVDHGIEGPGERVAHGKPPIGRLLLRAEAVAGRVRLTIADDGAGVDREAVVAQAVKVGLIDAGAAETITREEAYRLLFAPGFSTRRKVSEISGRGVGLDIVASAVARVGGEVLLAAEPGRGTTVVLEVPLARRGELVLKIRVGQSQLAVPSSAVREVLRFSQSAVIERDGRTYLDLEGRLVPFVPVARMFGEVPAETQVLLRGRASGQPLALAVDVVEGEEELLVRPVTRSAPVEAVIEGVALLASGRPIGVLSPAVLAQRTLLRQPILATVTAPGAPRLSVLLVDDSLVTREMERRLLEDAGFTVTAAGDAEECMSFLGEMSFDCLVTDIEMPGMDGFDLTRRLRSIPQFSQLPIIVVSTRDRPEDRLQGLQAGADAYLTKQSLDAGELVDLVRRLSGTR
ncbi:MAG: response regulator [Thermoanaerobaculia bacterium]|nr:response regulator [Thermoanaerobaculia bacterium]